MAKISNSSLESIKSHCVDDESDCWIWQGYVTKNGHPMIHTCCGPAYVRRVVLSCVGRAPAPRVPVVPTCGKKLCCNPAHQHATTASAIAQGRAKCADRAKKIALARRAQSKLTDEAAQQIRIANEPARVLAQRHGVSLSRVYAIRRGDSWKEYGGSLAAICSIRQL